MGPLARPTARPSVDDRERVARMLRRACDDQRLSLDTFAARLGAVYSARHETDLRELVADIPDTHRLDRLLASTAMWLSATTVRLQDAWSRARTPVLVLPRREAVLIGRSRDCECVLADATVSRRHALLTFSGAEWRLRDLASVNGTFVNNRRVIDDVEVRPGDQVQFGLARFSLAASENADASKASRPAAAA